VNRGVLIHSFHERESTFVPMCPELFLHSWINLPDNLLSAKLRRLLGQILDLRGCFTRKKIENLHSDWEQLIRLARPERYTRMPLCDVYRIRSSANNAPDRVHQLVFCPVDAAAELKLISYEKNTVIDVQINTIISPTYDYNPGWDRLIFYEARGSNKKNRLPSTLPVFIQNIFNNTSTILSLDVVQVVNHCRDFLRHKCRFTRNKLFSAKKATFFSSKPPNFVLIFIIKRHISDSC
jgi:hypothetical protein